MSADNWRTCPICSEEFENSKNKYIKELKESYGKVNESTYLKLKEKVDNTPEEFGRDDFREDYEIGMLEDGTLKIRYKGCCMKCGCGKEYEYKEKVKLIKGRII